MGFYRRYEVDVDGQRAIASLIDCVNVQRVPGVRDQILGGSFHQVQVSKPDARSVTVEKPFGYVDLQRKQFFLVRPRSERNQFRKAGSQLERMINLLPKHFLKQAKLRVIFGLAELREKLLADEAGIDDRELELLKAMCVREHPFLLNQARLRLTLKDRSPKHLSLQAAYDHNPRQYEIRVPINTLDALAQSRPALKKIVAKAHKANILDSEDPIHWVNFGRWNPGLTFLEQLRALAADISEGVQIDAAAIDFRKLLAGLPHGSHLPTWAKQSLDVLFGWAVQSGNDALQDDIFEARFDRTLDDDWSLNNDPDDIDTLYKILRVLPASNVESNISLREISLIHGESSYYSPTKHDVQIGEGALANQERFEDTFRHEIGHAVHDANQDLINTWLADQFGWRMFNVDADAEIDEWVDLLGGYGSVSTLERTQIRSYIRKAVGPGSSWSPPEATLAPPNHPWNRPDFKPRLAIYQSGSEWYNNNQGWLLRGGLRFAANYWYKELMVVNDKTLKFINQKMPDVYAAMSPLEFFAELYALYFDLDDPQNRNIPGDVRDWMKANIGDGAEPTATLPGAKAKAKSAGTRSTGRTASGKRRDQPGRK